MGRRAKRVAHPVIDPGAPKRSSINDVTVFRGADKEICDDRTEALVMKDMTMVGGGPKFRDVIYGRPLS